MGSQGLVGMWQKVLAYVVGLVRSEVCPGAGVKSGWVRRPLCVISGWPGVRWVVGVVASVQDTKRFVQGSNPRLQH